MIDWAIKVFGQHPIDESYILIEIISANINNANNHVSMDTTNLLSYQNYSGLAFNLYLNGGSQPLVRGERFDGNKTATDKIRPAIGFSMDVTRLLPYFDMPKPRLVLVGFVDPQQAS